MRDAHPTTAPGRARLGASLFFFTNGAVLATLLPRYPEIKGALELGDGTFGLVVAALPLGSLIASGLPAPLMRRFGAPAVAAAGTALLAAASLLAALAPNSALFAFALFCAGVTDAVVDAAQNVHGLRVQRYLGRSVLNSMHALWSIGAALGGAAGAAAAAAHVPIPIQVAVNAAVCIGLACAGATLTRIPADVPSSDAPTDTQATGSRGPWPALVPLVMLAVSGVLVEDVANNWSALYLHDHLDAPPGLAGLGLVTMLGAQFVGRLLGDVMTDRWGVARVAQAGGLLVASGSALAVAAPRPGIALVGFALAGFGCATLVPAAFAGAEALPGFRPGTAVTMVGWLMRIGFLGSSPLIGAISDRAGLTAGLLVPVVAGLCGAVVATRLPRR